MTTRMMRMATTTAAVALLAVGAAACGSSDDSSDNAKSKTTSSKTDTAMTSSDTTSTDTTMSNTGATDTGTASSSSGSGGTLDAEVGKDDAFVITLQQDGKDVTDLKAGTYTIKVKDESAIHNFHLTGPGGVDMTTDVQAKEDKTWTVDLKAGTYKYVCDPHVSSMSGDFTVS